MKQYINVIHQYFSVFVNFVIMYLYPVLRKKVSM